MTDPSKRPEAVYDLTKPCEKPCLIVRSLEPHKAVTSLSDNLIVKVDAETCARLIDQLQSILQTLERQAEVPPLTIGLVQ